MAATQARRVSKDPQLAPQGIASDWSNDRATGGIRNLALALTAGFASKLTHLSAIMLSLLIWTTAEGFRGPYPSGTSNIGTTTLYVLVFGALLSFSRYQGVARRSAWPLGTNGRSAGGIGAPRSGTTTSQPLWPTPPTSAAHTPATPQQGRHRATSPPCTHASPRPAPTGH